MRLKKSLEQAVCVLILLANEAKDKPMKSHLLSQRLQLSDSYLKKIMRKLVVEHIVLSDASKDGGFSLARPISTISMLDVYYAIEGRESFLQLDHVAERLFQQTDRIMQAENNVMQVISDAENQFLSRLGAYPLSNLLEKS